jgi:hypothetical protein
MGLVTRIYSDHYSILLTQSNPPGLLESLSIITGGLLFYLQPRIATYTARVSQNYNTRIFSREAPRSNKKNQRMTEPTTDLFRSRVCSACSPKPKPLFPRKNTNINITVYFIDSGGGNMPLQFVGQHSTRVRLWEKESGLGGQRGHRAVAAQRHQKR